MNRACTRWLAGLLATLLVTSTSAHASTAAGGLTDRQVTLLTNNCVQCHARPGIGVPLMGNPPDWSERIKQGEDTLLVNVVHGLRGMPPLGYCSACDEADLRALIRAMTGIGSTATGSGK